MRISDWSSDVCSSDLQSGHQAAGKRIAAQPNLHRHALDDAHEIAGRIVGGDQAKGRTAARREAVDKSVQRHVGIAVDADAYRSEEHTSELQSLMRISYAVFCLIKKINTRHHSIYPITIFT